MNNYILTLFLILISLILVFYLWSAYIKNKNKLKTIQITENIKNKISKNNLSNLNKFNVDLINNKNKTKSMGIIHKPIQKNTIKKAANWTETTSYEDDIKNLDMDTILNNNIKNNVVTQKIKITEDTILDNKKPLILLVDDSMVVRKYVSDLLTKNNYELIIKNDGLEALNYLKNTINKPELIISDIEMPNMNGIELVGEIRKQKKFNSIPILIISSYAAIHLQLMENESIQGFIKKPFEDKDLLTQSLYLINNY